MNKEFFCGKKALVMGLGQFGGGVDAAKFLCRAGAKVIITDLAVADKLSGSINQLREFSGIEYHLGSHKPADFGNADIVVANPAVPPDNKFLQIAKDAKKIITSQIEIFFELCPAVIAGITGANGKSTTTALTVYLLRAVLRKNKKRKIWLGGNIGNEPLLTELDKIIADDLIVLELSSFQIEQLARIKKAPKIALLTNLMPNHLDRYGTFDNYCAAKENIFRFQKQDERGKAVSIFNADDKIGMQWFEKYKKDSFRVCIKFSADDVNESIRENFNLPGRANLSNLAAALNIARQFGVDGEQIKNHLPAFKALPHRLEFVTQINGVKWYNDSKATTPESSIVALEAFDGPEIIIAGGYDKHLPLDKFAKKIAQRAKAAILIGQTAPKIADGIKKYLATASTEVLKKKIKIEIVKTLEQAVELANQLAVKGDIVLLSTACASYDMFVNYEHRGSEFARLVRLLDSRK